MTPRKVAVWLNSCTDEEFLETFALLYKAMDGRGIPTEYDANGMINNMNIKLLCYHLGDILNEMKK